MRSTAWWMRREQWILSSWISVRPLTLPPIRTWQTSCCSRGWMSRQCCGLKIVWVSISTWEFSNVSQSDKGITTPLNYDTLEFYHLTCSFGFFDHFLFLYFLHLTLNPFSVLMSWTSRLLIFNKCVSVSNFISTYCLDLYEHHSWNDSMGLCKVF